MLAPRYSLAIFAVGLAAAPALAQPAARLDRLGDPLPAGAVYRIGTNRLQIVYGGDFPHTITTSRDGRYIGCIQPGRLSIWEATTGREIAGTDLDYKEAWPGFAIAFTPDGKCVGFSKGEALALLDLTTKKTREMRVGGLVCEARFAADGRTVTTLSLCLGPFLSPTPLVNQADVGPWVSRWDVASGKLLNRLRLDLAVAPGGLMMESHRLSPDGSLVAKVKVDSARQHPELQLRDTVTGKVAQQWPLPTPDEPCIAFSMDGKWLALRSENTIRVMEIASGKELGRCELGAKLARSGVLAFAPDGTSLYCGTDSALARWDWHAGKMLHEYPDAHQSLGFLANGKTLVVVGENGFLRFLDAETGEGPRRAAPVGDQVAFSSDSRLIAWTEGEAVVLGDAASGKVMRRWPAEVSAISPLAITPDGKLLATATAARIHLWDVNTGGEIRRIDSSSDVTLLDFTSDGRRLASGNWAAGCLWDVRTGKSLTTWTGATEAVVSSRAKAVAMVEDRTVRIVDPLTNKTMQSIEGCRERVSSEIRPPDGMSRHFRSGRATPVFSPDSRFLLAPGDVDNDAHGNGGLLVWEIATGKRRPAVLRGDAMSFEKVAFSHDSRLLAAMDMHCRICLVDTASGEIRKLGQGADAMTARPAFTPDGRLLVTAVGGVVQIWEVATGGEIARREGHRGDVQALVVSADGRRLATVSIDHTILVWDLARLFADDPRAPASPQALWNDLASFDAPRGRRAVERLIASPAQALQLASEQLAPAADPSVKRTARWSADLDAKVETLLAKLGCRPLSPDDLRIVRAVQVLEGIGDTESRKLLAQWATGAAGARLTVEATAALARLANQDVTLDP